MRLALLLLAASVVMAQQAPQKPESGEARNQKEEAPEGPSAFEIEFVASDVFRSGSYLQPIWRGLGFEGHYFGEGSTNVGFTGGSWMFRLGELKLSPGFGVLFGGHKIAAAPAVSFRWDYERAWFVTQALWVQSLRSTPVHEEGEGEASVHSEQPAESAERVWPTVWDGNHVSGRWKRLTIGGTWEHIHFREENEWKGGGRVAFRLLPRLSAILYVFGPGRAEWRGGFLIHPPRRD